MSQEEFEQLCIELKDEGANDDYAHEVIANIMNETVYELAGGKTLTEDQRRLAEQAYMDGFIEAEGGVTNE